MREDRMKENERLEPRFKVHIQDTEFSARIIDISSTGCHIQTTNKYHLGDICKLSIKVGDLKEVKTLSGKIVWGKLKEKQVLGEEDDFEYGLTFQESKGMNMSEIMEIIIKNIK